MSGLVLFDESLDRPWGKFVQIHTIQMGKYRLLNGTGIELIDTTIKSSDEVTKRLFAPPSWELVNGVKNGAISEEEYTRQYIEKLNYTSSVYLDEWLWFLDKERIAISCFCGSTCFCHRHILANFMMGLANEWGYYPIMAGEIG